MTPSDEGKKELDTKIESLKKEEKSLLLSLGKVREELLSAEKTLSKVNRKRREAIRNSPKVPA